MGWEDWKLIVAAPLTFGVLAVIAFAFMANPEASAAFFGAFAAAAATVIAVLLGGYVQRKNDLTREKRARNVELAAVGTEISIHLSRGTNGIQVLLLRLDGIANWLPANAALGQPAPQTLAYTSIPNSLETYLFPFEDRLARNIGRFPRPVAEILIVYHSNAAQMLSVANNYTQSSKLQSKPWVGQLDATQLAASIRNVVSLANIANQRLTEELENMAAADR